MNSAAEAFHRGALATASPIATRLGLDVFERGGNAFDVAVAVGFVLAVSHPEAGNIGGGGYAVCRNGHTGEIEMLDFRETAPSAAREKMYLDSNGNVIPELSTFGAMAAGVPGTVAGLYALWKSHGTLPWHELVGLAASLADSGFTVDSYLSNSLAASEAGLGRFNESAAIFLPAGRPPQPGERLVQKDLAFALRLIASDGPDAFYRGKIARQIAVTMKLHHGLISERDLASYRPIWRLPVHFRFDSLDIYSTALSSSGGTVVGQILKLLEPYDLSGMTPTSAPYIHLFCEAAKLAYADRAVHLGDPDFYNVPCKLLDSAYLAERRIVIDSAHAVASELIRPGTPAPCESEHTTHYSVCDSAGNMVAVTYTLNTSYGSKLVVAGAGFLLNNEMDDFSVKPGVPNTYGLVGGEANRIEPGKRMLSSMAPTIVLKDGHPFLILGSPGGSKIITTVAEAIMCVTRFHRTIKETVAIPRFHHQWLPDILFLEEASFAPGVKETLEERGYKVEKIAPWCDLQMVAVDSSGSMMSASDPRRNGAAGGW